MGKLVTIATIRKNLRAHGKYVPETATIYNFLVNKGFTPKKHTYLVKTAFAANAESEVGRNLYLLQQMDNDNNRAQEWAKNNTTAPSNRPNYVPRRHGETNASLELLRNDESINKKALLEYYGNPDNISGEGNSLRWRDSDTITFGYFPVTLDNEYKFFSIEQNEDNMSAHYDLAVKARQVLIKGRDSAFDYSELGYITSCIIEKGVLLGRCWENAKVISFWTPLELEDRDYSSSNIKPSDLVKVLTDLDITENEYGDWTLVTTEGDYGVKDYVYDAESLLINSRLIFYDPSYKIDMPWELNEKIWDKIEEINTPMETGKRQQIDSKLGNMTYAQYRSMLYQEGEKPSLTVVNNVLNSNRIVEGKNDNKRRKIYMNESQLRRLLENSIDDGFRMSFNKENGQINQNNPNMVMFDPNTKGYADTKIFKDGGKEFNIYYQELPKSGLMSINLYNITNMNVNKALKHGKNVSGNKVNIGNRNASDSLTYFKKRSAYYITRILNKMGVMPDVFTSPQSSSKFNESMLQLLSKYYPNGDVLLMPNSMRKDPRSVYVNINVAKKLGMTDEEIAKLQNKVDNMKKDEDIRDFRRKIEILKKEIDGLLTHKRGRPSKEITNRRDEIEAYETLIKANRRRGKDPTIDKSTGQIKPMQIKSMDDKQRRAIDGLFVFNDMDYPSKTFSNGAEEFTYSQTMRIKNKVVLVFDDNLSSGATLDMMCDALLKMGAKKVIPITLGIIPQTAYNPSERVNLRH